MNQVKIVSGVESKYIFNRSSFIVFKNSKKFFIGMFPCVSRSGTHLDESLGLISAVSVDGRRLGFNVLLWSLL